MSVREFEPMRAEDVRAARQAANGRRLIEVLEERVGVSGFDFATRVALLVDARALDAAALLAAEPCFKQLSFSEALRLECVVLRRPDEQPLLVVADPFDDALRDRVGALLGHGLHVAVAHRADILACLHRYEEGSRALDDIVGLVTGGERSEEIEEISLKNISNDGSPVVRLVNSTLLDALKTGASDIHLESVPGGITVRHRVDGVLASVSSLQGEDLAEQVVSRIKVMAELDIAERRVPQDGRFRVAYQDREIDLRVSVMPSIHGEDAVLRILDRRALSDQVNSLTLDRLGFHGEALDQLRRLAGLPYGMLLVTGPTGSGKTTTLYAALGEINNGEDKIITIEDPVEYQLPGVLQIPVNEKKGLTFARGLRSILRHDPDKVMVGEIRDGETAQIAVQAALTGHLVFTTVHANNVFDVLGRFSHMGVDPYSLVAALNGVVAQRLLRLNCPHCSVDVTPAPDVLRRSGIAGADSFRFRAGQGCGQCRGTGYKGRRAVAEILLLDDMLREMIVGREPIRRIKEAAQAAGTRVLREVALDVLRNGETSLEELNRVVA
ncbi:MAG TPA: GspE/PulE family protein [Rhodocyclaceae bacterium]|nr:GspE/PulE family protein [Rhodocyclaceae bacterium]